MTKIQLIEASIAVLTYFVLRLIVSQSIGKIIATNNAKTRIRIIKKAINFTVLLVFLTIIFSIFGVNQSELVVFIGSFLTVMGIAFFAQWSLLSNITSGIIIFFNHSIKLDDTLAIIDKDYTVEGKIIDIGLFFVTIKTKEDDEVTIPNNVFVQKMIKKYKNE